MHRLGLAGARANELLGVLLEVALARRGGDGHGKVDEQQRRHVVDDATPRRAP
jgi:hypothetical protein